MLYWLLKSVLLGPLMRLLFRPSVEGAQYVPQHGPAILASNHLSFSDSLFLPLVLQRRITFPAKMEYFTDRSFKGRLKAFFFRGTGQIPIDRTGGQASRAAIDAGLEVLAEGGLFGIYPEGTRSPDGRLYRGKTGIARMALEAGVPIIPVAMIDTDKAQPTGQKIPTITPVGVRFGPPIDISGYMGRQDDRAVLREITDRVMAELARLSGQEYVDEYAAVRKAAIAARAEELLELAKVESEKARAKAEELVAAARAETVQARVKAEELIATARTESEKASEKARVKAEEFVGQARVESEKARARAEEFVGQARTESEKARGRAEDFVTAAVDRARGMRDKDGRQEPGASGADTVDTAAAHDAAAQDPLDVVDAHDPLDAVDAVDAVVPPQTVPVDEEHAATGQARQPQRADVAGLG